MGAEAGHEEQVAEPIVAGRLRNEGALALSGTEVEPLFARGFALEQLHANFSDLSRWVYEHAESMREKIT